MSTARSASVSSVSSYQSSIRINRERDTPQTRFHIEKLTLRIDSYSRLGRTISSPTRMPKLSSPTTSVIFAELAGLTLHQSSESSCRGRSGTLTVACPKICVRDELFEDWMTRIVIGEVKGGKSLERGFQPSDSWSIPVEGLTRT